MGSRRRRREGIAGGLTFASIVGSNAVFEHDPTKTDPAPTSQTLPSTIANPFSGTQAGYLLTFGATTGATTDDPTQRDYGTPDAYTEFDGGDSLQALATPAWVQKVQRTDQVIGVTGVFAFRHIADGVANSLMGTSAATTEIGFRLHMTTAERVQLSMRGDTASVATASGSGPLLANNQDYVIIWTWNGTTAVFYVNGVKYSLALAANTCVSDSTLILGVGCSRNGQGRVPANTRVYYDAMAQGVVDDAQAAAILQMLRTTRNVAFTAVPG